jgi:hypothetical protein
MRDNLNSIVDAQTTPTTEKLTAMDLRWIKKLQEYLDEAGSILPNPTKTEKAYAEYIAKCLDSFPLTTYENVRKGGDHVLLRSLKALGDRGGYSGLKNLFQGDFLDKIELMQRKLHETSLGADALLMQVKNLRLKQELDKAFEGLTLKNRDTGGKPSGNIRFGEPNPAYN